MERFISCQIGFPCSENGEFSGDWRKFENPSSERNPGGSFGDADSGVANVVKTDRMASSDSVDYKAYD